MARMNRSELEAAVREGILTGEQADRLVSFYSRQPAAPGFTFVNVLYYLGGMIAIGAMSLFMTLAWNRLGGWGGFLTALCYVVLFLALTHWFMERKGLAIPAGIMATLAVVTVPLAIFSAQMALGYWTADKPYRLVAAPARTFLNSTFTETPGSLKREKRPTVLMHPEACAALKVGDGDRVRLGNERGEVIVHVKPQAGQLPDVVVVEGIWPNKYFENGIGINAITSAQPGWPNGGAVFHDTAVWIRPV